MTKSLSLPRRLGHVARMIAAFAGPPIERWSPRPQLPAAPAPTAHELGHGITLWRLPVGVVRIRERHRALPTDLADVDDKLRFPVMMSFTLNNPHVIDFALKQGSFSRLWSQGFV